MLEVSNIDTYRGPAHILHGVSISVGEGETVCLVGRNGAGKTTTIESIIGLLPVRSGTIAFRGEDITALPAHRRARRGIGYAPEASAIFPELSVAENMLIGRWIAAKDVRDDHSGDVETDRRVFSVFPEVRPLLSRRGMDLSGGQKKMVAIARAMSLSPALLLLDEAFEGLAPVVVARFRDAMNKIKAMGISLLIAESNLSSASLIADKMFAIDRGEIIYHGTPQGALTDEKVVKALKG